MPIIRTGKTGTGLNSSQTGVMQGAVGGGGGGGILLPGLIGWALTAGPQQTLSSAGVIASGPQDWTEISTPTYGAQGVSTNGASTGLQIPTNSGIETGHVSFGFELWVNPSVLAQQPNPRGDLMYKAGSIDEYGFYFGSEAPWAAVFYMNDGESFVNAEVNVSEAGLWGSRSQIIGWVDIDALTANICHNNGAVSSSPILDTHAAATDGQLTLGGYDPASLNTKGVFGPIRFWNNPSDISATLGNSSVRTAMYNGGTPLTDAELIAL